jgi:hypothetical protein
MRPQVATIQDLIYGADIEASDDGKGSESSGPRRAEVT